jgi:alkylation response protein AidB-like acyl-CoA dehydrogenase
MRERGNEMLTTHMKQAAENLGLVGRFLLAEREADLWEDETDTLPGSLAKYRRRCREFADNVLRPRSLEVEANLYEFDPAPLFQESARWGFQSQYLPWPWGTGSLREVAAMPSPTFGVLLRAEEFCAACGGLGLLLQAHDLGMAPLLLSGTWTGLKWMRRIYKKIMAGERCVAAFAITEPGAGSDVEETIGAASARIVSRAKKVAGGYVINGRKCFISDGGIADYVTFFAALEDGGVDSWTCFLVESDMKGYSVGRREKKMGQKAADASELILEDVFVPGDHRIGKERSGWALNRNVLNYSRPPVAAIAVGIARGALERCIEFCRKSRLGNKRLIDYQDVQIELADMMIQLMAARALTWYCGRYRLPPQGISASAKVFAGDTAFAVCNRAMELMGDHGYLHAHGVEKAMRDARLNQIYEGTNQINRLALIEDAWETDFENSS